ncbi:MAG: hypothetical protein ACFCGT_04215 [Sandaracinaceae bacterium]
MRTIAVAVILMAWPPALLAAQDTGSGEGGTVAAPPASGAEGQAAAGDAGQPAAGAEAQPAAAAPAAPPDGARLRHGTDLGAGVYGSPFPAPRRAGFAAVWQGRLGVQLNNLLGIYAQTGFISGLLSRSNALQFDWTWSAAAAFDFTFGHVMQIGAAGGVDVVGGSRRTHAWTGLEGKLAFLLGGSGPGRRQGLAFSVRWHGTLANEMGAVQVYQALYLAIGTEAY